MTTVLDMPLATILARLREKADALRAEGVAKLYVFGSRSRGDARPDSDLDVLVELRSDFAIGWKTPLEIGYLCEEATGISTQVTLRGDHLKPRFLERIADDLVEAL
ncbi:nucleotidyltransferase family protein [Rhodopseudomonas palustris]|uniref:Nucleotidyltransferase domain-containing protein n=1 Tax=Rhodopseudomonas palustris TaxID=1076 RepID=A0A418VE72_RHOPL|nr:nucleotidyltransferase domain-containing protein [Rhodopseudomonas palustris]RJF74383.1 nucleotidyltransferase domain-containing protein [Rhodopseudomonas palustris]